MKLRWHLPDGASGDVEITKRVISIGADKKNDVSVRARGLAGHHAYLMVRGDRIQVGSLSAHALSVNGKRARESLIKPGDQLKLGDLTIEIFPGEEPIPVASSPSASLPDEALERVLWFTQRLAEMPAPARLLDTLLDLLITALETERGMVVIGPLESPRVVAARGIDPSKTQAELTRLPDRLLKRLFESRSPIATSDAASEGDLVGSTTVVQLGLKCILALPLIVANQMQGVLVLAASRPSPGFSPAGLREAALYSAQASLLIQHVLRIHSLEDELGEARSTLEELGLGEVVVVSEGMTKVIQMVRKVAKSDLSVLLRGATGTGKEVVAREMHRLSARSGGPFLAINCGAIPEGLIESELFGHVKGAFSGADSDRKGLVEAATGGTLFLDEIGDMPRSVQVRLLRVLQERAVTRVGDTRLRPVDFRLVAATHRDLSRAIEEGSFREDLYYRVRDVELVLPPLRERTEDILLLARHFVDSYSKRQERPRVTLSPAAQQALLKHGWPGNIRELEGRIKRAIVLADDRVIEPHHLDLAANPSVQPQTLDQAVREFRASTVRRVIAECGGRRKRAAAVLAVDRRTISRYLRKS